MTTQLNFSRDVQGMNAYAPQMSDLMFSASLATTTQDDVVVPGSNENWIVAFSYQPGASIWVAINDTAAAPAGASFAASTSFLNPAQIKVKAGDTISCFNNSTQSQDVGFALYAI